MTLLPLSRIRGVTYTYKVVFSHILKYQVLNLYNKIQVLPNLVLVNQEYNPQNQTIDRPWDLFRYLQLSSRKILTSNQKELTIKFLPKIYIILGIYFGICNLVLEKS